MNKKTKLALSIRKQFGCSQRDADAWADDVIASESQPNGRLGSFQEFTESTADNVGDLIERVRLRLRSKAGIKTYNQPDERDDFTLRIQNRGGMR